MGGARAKAGRHKKDCTCQKCQAKQEKQGSRPTDANLARKLKAKIVAEKKWLEIIEVEVELMRELGKTSPLKKTLMYLDDRDLGKPVDTVNHVHDKPIDVNMKISLADTINKARKRAGV